MALKKKKPTLNSHISKTRTNFWVITQIFWNWIQFSSKQLYFLRALHTWVYGSRLRSLQWLGWNVKERNIVFLIISNKYFYVRMLVLYSEAYLGPCPLKHLWWSVFPKFLTAKSRPKHTSSIQIFQESLDQKKNT